MVGDAEVSAELSGVETRCPLTILVVLETEMMGAHYEPEAC